MSDLYVLTKGMFAMDLSTWMECSPENWCNIDDFVRKSITGIVCVNDLAEKKLKMSCPLEDLILQWDHC